MNYDEHYKKTLREIIDLATKATESFREKKDEIGPDEFYFMTSVLGQALGMIIIMGLAENQTLNKAIAVTSIFSLFRDDALSVLNKEPCRGAKVLRLEIERARRGQLNEQ